MSPILHANSRWLVQVAAIGCLSILISPSFASQLRIQPGDIVCALSEEIPVSIAPNGDVVVTITDSESCLPQAAPPLEPSLSRLILDQNAPGEVQLTWTSSEGASSCEATSNPSISGWTGTVSLGDGQTRTLTGLAEGGYTFGLTCTNSAGTSPAAEANATIFSSAPAECANRQPPAEWTRLTSGCRFVFGSGFQGDCTSWDAVFAGGFTEVQGTTERIATNRLLPKHYLALQFNTGDLAPTQVGSLSSDRAGGMMEFHRRIYSISTCPGDFDRENAETGCYGELSAIFGLRWGGPESTRSCKLEPNTTYFLNIIGTDSPLGTSPDLIQPNCPNNENCGAVYDPQ